MCLLIFLYREEVTLICEYMYKICHVEKSVHTVSNVDMQFQKDSRSGSVSSVSSDGDDMFEPWTAKRAGILGKYTTSEKLSITTSFLSSADKEKGMQRMFRS